MEYKSPNILQFITSAQILDSLTEPVAVIGPGGMLLAVNQNWQASAQSPAVSLLQGLTPGGNLLTALSQPGPELILQDDFASALNAILDGSEQSKILYYTVHTDDGAKWFGLRIIPMQHEQARAMVLHLDFTDQKLTEIATRNAEARVRSIIENAVDAIITINERGIMLTVNPAVERMFGYAPEELIGRNVSMLMPAPDSERHDGYLHNYLSTGQKKIIGIGREVQGKRKDGVAFPVHLAVSEVQLDGQRTFIGSLRDISDLKQAQADQQRLIDELRQALEQVKTLSGLLPICASCKSIRDDSGYWSKIEEYISAHTEAEFSHSLCPACTEKLYPDYYKRMMEKRKNEP